jgi:hypothetical protein
VDHKLPLQPNAGPPLAAHTSYLVKRGSTELKIAVATTDPTNQGRALARIPASLRLL